MVKSFEIWRLSCEYYDIYNILQLDVLNNEDVFNWESLSI